MQQNNNTDSHLIHTMYRERKGHLSRTIKKATHQRNTETAIFKEIYKKAST
jgi:hypothetical protein